MIHLLRAVHVLSGVVWVGCAFFLAAFLIPSVRAVGPAAGPIMGQLTQARQLHRWLLITATLTVLSGVGLYWQVSSGFSPAWMISGPGVTFTVGAILALIGWTMGLTLNAPLSRRLGALNAQIAASGRPPTAAVGTQIAAMQSRLGTLSVTGTTFLMLATLAMAVARYVR